jgi:exodeoxyribonuclease V
MTTTTNNILNYLPFENPTQEQIIALKEIELFTKHDTFDDFFILSGAAGTGKTSITIAIVSHLIEQNLNFHIIAPTGRATRILGQKAGVYGNTIHSKIYNTTTESDTGIVYCHIKPVSQEDKKETIFIIDESSMINALPNTDEENLFQSNNALLTDIITYVKSTHANSKILFLGDSNQLCPIGEKLSQALDVTYLTNSFQLKGKSTKLTQVMRQKEDSLIMKNAINTRIAIENNQKNLSIDAFKFSSSIHGASSHYVKNYLSNGPDDAIAIGKSNKSNLYFNDIVRKKLYGNNVSKIEKGDYLLVTKGYERNGVKLYSGDHVVIEDVQVGNPENIADAQFIYVRAASKNVRNEKVIIEDVIRYDLLNVPTGHRGLKMENNLRKERFAKNTSLRETNRAMDDKYLGALKLTYGHAITCNKAQGGEWNNIYLNTISIPDLKWQYTAITRAKNELRLF